MKEMSMYDRFTDRARMVMQLASQEAHRCNHSHVGLAALSGRLQAQQELIDKLQARVVALETKASEGKRGREFL